ncbi:MAG TPA: AAA family ATPase [Nocardioidaceae bacterium]|nr:AAA family ATPase [Nocardioidaceae bacterium]
MSETESPAADPEPAAPEPADPEPADPELAAEWAHLTESRTNLARMRARTAGLDRNTAGDWVSQQFLDASLLRRMKQLEDDPTVPLFFGRLDYDAAHADGQGERFYIGRRHVTDPAGDPLVIDWRAEISRAFYQASKADPMGVELRRRFGFVHGSLTAFEDERLTAGEQETHSEILEYEIERPRVGPMRDIVATIQPEQDTIVRSRLDTSVCVQGAPGTGKTAVGLHRAAYLLYAHRDQLHRQGVLVVGPNASFLRYIGDVLPALGEIDAKQTTLEEMVGARVPIRGEDPPDVATLKGDPRLAELLHRAVWSKVTAPTEGLVVPRGASRWRVPAYEAEEIVTELRGRGVRYGAARTMLPQRLAHRILVKMEMAGDSPDDRVHATVARSRPVKAYADARWPAVDPAKLVFSLLSSRDELSRHAAGLLSDDEVALLVWAKSPRSAGSARWSVADAVLVDEVADLVERTTSLGHVVVDEAQDLSPMMLRAVGRRCSTGSVTVLGDLAQATTPWATRAWSDALAHLGKPDAHVEELTLGFRVPLDVIEFAARLLPDIAPGLAPPTSVRRTRGDLEVTPAAAPVDAAVAAVRAALHHAGSIGVIVPDSLATKVSRALTEHGIDFSRLGDADDVDARVDLVPASLAKGLEFDHVVLVEPAGIVAGEADHVTGLRRLYVCLTRAVTSLHVLYAEELPTALAGTSWVGSTTS